MVYLGVDIGGTNIKMGLVENGNILKKTSFKTPKDVEVLTDEIVSFKNLNWISPFVAFGFVKNPFLDGLINQSPAIAKIFKVLSSSACWKISFLFVSIVLTNLGKECTLPWLSDVARILTLAALKLGDIDCPDTELIFIFETSLTKL